MLKTLAYTLGGVVFLAAAEARAAVNIAVIAPEEGKYQEFGRQIVEGVRIAVNGINRSGGLKGEKINLITVDERCNDSLAVSTAQMMAVNVSEADKVSLVIGPYCSNALEQVVDIYTKAKIFQILPIPVNSGRLEGKHPGLVKLAGYKDTQSADFYNYYNKRFAGEKVALIYDSNDRDIIDIAAALQQEFKKNGKLDMLQAYSYASYDDIDALSEEVLKDDLHIAYVLGLPQQVAEISRELKSEKEEFVIFSNKYAAQEDYFKIMGRYGDETYYIGLPSLQNNPDFVATLVHLRLLGIEPEGLGVYGFSAVKLWEDLVKKSDSFAYEKLADTLKKETINTTWGNVSFQNGVPADTFNFGIYRRRDGQYTQVY